MIDVPPTEACVLFCTHKRGAGLAFFRVRSQSLSDALLDAVEQFVLLAEQSPQQREIQQTAASVLFFRSRDDSFLSAVSAGMTAENLSELYRLGLAELGLTDLNIGCVGVVSGPGSFTGLRLGCAFANGLTLGRARSLWAVNGLHPDAVREVCSVSSLPIDSYFWGEKSAHIDDPYAAPTSFGDILAHLKNWSAGSAEKVETVEPLYGREPTPVLKLKLQQGELPS